MTVIHKFCNTCSKTTLHNPMKGGGERCTGCALPYGTGPKAERHKTMGTTKHLGLPASLKRHTYSK